MARVRDWSKLPCSAESPATLAEFTEHARERPNLISEISVLISNSHSENSITVRAFDRCVIDHCEAHSQIVPCLSRVNDTIIPYLTR